ncbi:MAG: hypothetical protein U0556_14340 [Dehalococcoidia bacterium]
MAFAFEDFEDLLRILDEHPDWRDQLRRRLLSDEFLHLPYLTQKIDDRLSRLEETVQALLDAHARSDVRLSRIEAAIEILAQAQARTEVRLEELAQAQARTEVRLEELAQAQARTEVRLEELAQAQVRTEARLEELAQAQARTEARLEELAQAQARTEVRLEELAQAQARTEAAVQETTTTVARLEARLEETVVAVRRLDTRVGRLQGDSLERRYRERAGSYFGGLLRRPRPVDLNDLRDSIEDRLTADEVEEALRADLFVRGSLRAEPGREILIVLEVSAVIDAHDIGRALRRARLLRQAGHHAVAAVGGEAVDGESSDVVPEAVAVFLDGTVAHWDSALAQARTD